LSSKNQKRLKQTFLLGPWTNILLFVSTLNFPGFERFECDGCQTERQGGAMQSGRAEGRLQASKRSTKMAPLRQAVEAV
jgi:hypothetical protein